MDTSIKLAKLYSSFEPRKIKYKGPNPYKGAKNKFKSNLTYTEQEELLYKKTNMVYPVCDSIFMDHNAVELANIDSVLNLTNSNFGLVGTILSQKIYDGQDFVFCDMGGVPGGYTQYLQYRMKRSHGFGISRNNNSSDPPPSWDSNGIELNGLNTFTRLEGEQDHTGDIITNIESMYKLIYQYYPNGIDIAILNPTTQSKNYFRYLLVQSLLGIKLLSKNGVLVAKIPESTSSRILQFMYLLSIKFEYLYLFKPFSSGFSSIKYIIGRNLKEDDSVESLLSSVHSHIIKDKSKINIKSLIDTNTIDSKFKQYITSVNNEVDLFETNYKVEQYNLNRLFYYWDIPSFGETKIYRRF